MFEVLVYTNHYNMKYYELLHLLLKRWSSWLVIKWRRKMIVSIWNLEISVTETMAFLYWILLGQQINASVVLSIKNRAGWWETKTKLATTPHRTHTLSSQAQSYSFLPTLLFSHLPEKCRGVGNGVAVNSSHLVSDASSSSCCPLAPAQGPFHRMQPFMNCSSLVPSYKLQFFKSCSSVAPFYGVESFRNRLL